MKAVLIVLGLILGVCGTTLAAESGEAPLAATEAKNKAKAFNEYSALSCSVMAADGEELATFKEKFMVVKMDDHAGLFRQMRLQSGLDQIQLQVLLEQDFQKRSETAINVLVNFAVNDKEISSEFVAENVSSLSIKNQQYKAECSVE